MLRNWSANVCMVFRIAKALGLSQIDYAKADKIASKFCFFELDRIYSHVKTRRITN
jgi:hypothetical protein